MALRSRYRTAEIANTQPEIKLDGAEPEAATGISVEAPPEAEPAVAVVSADQYPEPDEATAALLRQLESLRQSEALQRQHAQQMAQRQQPMTRVEFLRSQGLTPLEAQFFDSREDMMANQQLASEAAAEALAAGIERDSPQFFQAVEEGFAKRIEALKQPAAETPTPAFFAAPRPSPEPESVRDQRASIVSAPVSRGTASYETGQRPARTIRLTVEEQEYARVAGVSDVEYAKMKQKLILAKANGDYGERR